LTDAKGNDLLAAIGADSGSLKAQAGTPVEANGAPVVALVADGTFWVGPSLADAVLVHVSVPAGSVPVQVSVGDQVQFIGTLTEVPTGFADQQGITAAEGAGLLSAEGVYIETSSVQTI
jgi:hypothetical protein